jgi:hypothetical protein
LVFKHTYPGCIRDFVFDRSSVYKGFAEDALNINLMNLHPEGKQKKLYDTIILLNNLDLALGKEDTYGKVQHMCFPKDHEDLQLRGQPKGIRAVLEERKLV